MARTLEYAEVDRAPQSESVIGLIAFLTASFNSILMVIMFSIPSLSEQVQKLSPTTELAAILSLPFVAFLLGLYAILRSFKRYRGTRNTILQIAAEFILFRRERFGVAAIAIAILMIVCCVWIYTLPF